MLIIDQYALYVRFASDEWWEEAVNHTVQFFAEGTREWREFSLDDWDEVRNS